MTHRTRNAQVHPSIKNPPSLRISQYRPSFSIQLFLRLSSIPHLVYNSSTYCTEGTGPLPIVADVDQQALIGAQTPANTATSRFDGIFSYLLDKTNNIRGDHGNDDIIALSDGQNAERKSIMSQYHELTIILKCLRYGHDITWNEIYKKQCRKAHLYPNGDSNEMAVIGAETYYEKRGWTFLTWFQIWAERTVARKEIELDSIGKILMTDRNASSSGKQVDLKKATGMAGDIYSSLDWKLGQSKNGTLLDTTKMSLVDVLLFGHLAEALCDIHLVVTLINYKYLIRFFQKTYETYFGKKYQVSYSSSSGSNDNDISWIKWNDSVNALNQFNRIPMNDVERKIRETLDSGGYQDAIKIMQSVALHCHDLREVLADATILRKQEEKLYGVDNVPKSIVGKWLHTLRMGGKLGVEEVEKGEREEKDSNKDETTKKYEQHMKKVLREAKRNDELWISGTIVATILGLVASTVSGAE